MRELTGMEKDVLLKFNRLFKYSLIGMFGCHFVGQIRFVGGISRIIHPAQGETHQVLKRFPSKAVSRACSS